MKDLLVEIRILLILGFLSLFLVLVDSLGFLQVPKALLQTVTIPIQYGIYKSGDTVRKQVDFIFLARTSSLENKALRIQMGHLLAENSGLQTKLKEAETMIDSYNKLNPQTYDMLPARQLGISRYMLIDKGEIDGVKVGQAVVYKDSYLGQIKSVSSKTSQVLLSTDPDSKMAVFSRGKDGRAKGILEGQFGSEALMNKILHQEVVNEGDLVYSEGSEERLPRGLIMGKVVQVLQRQNEVFKQAKVEPLFVSEDLDIVFVIRSS